MRSEVGEHNELTILDYLNEDCWRAVLSYVPARDVMRTERASRRWQEVVLTYLRGVHISIIFEEIGKEKKNNFNTCTLKSPVYQSFEIWTSKLGSSVVDAYCKKWENLEIIRVNCPNLETLRLINLSDGAQTFPHNLNENFKNLKRLVFSNCRVSDNSITQLIADKALEELEFNCCDEVTGQCLNTINSSNLKSLVIEKGSKWKAEQFVPSVERLGELTRLILDYVQRDISERVQFVLDKMPKLKQLNIIDDQICCETFEPLSRLTQLRHLNLSIQLGDYGVETVMNCCKKLRTFTLDCEGVTSYGAQALARLGARLTRLTLVGFFELDDDGLVAIVRGCTKLKLLDVSGSSFLTPALPARAQAAWREARPQRRLTIDLTYTILESDECLGGFEGEQYEEMKRIYEEWNKNYRNLVIVLKPEDDENENEDDDDDGEESE